MSDVGLALATMAETVAREGKRRANEAVALKAAGFIDDAETLANEARGIIFAARMILGRYHELDGKP